MSFPGYIWRVVLLQPVQGFQKTAHVEAINYAEAVEKGERKLAEKGYDPGDFVVTALTRGTRV